jgi:general secretion pathway protein H
MLTRTVLAEGVMLKDVTTPRLGKVTDGEVSIDVGPGGMTEFLTIHLATADGASFTVAVFPAGGKVRIAEGNEEMTL